MRLLYVCSDFGIPPTGTKGASVHLRAITRALSDLGHEVLLLSPLKGPDADHPATRLLPPGCPLVKQGARPLKRWLVDHDLDEAVAKELRPLLYNVWAPQEALRALAGAPPVAIIERLSLFGHVGLDLANALQIPLIVEVNALLSEEAGRFRELRLRDLAGTMERRVLARADGVLAVSRPLGDKIAGLGMDPCKIEVVPNGVDARKFDKLPSKDDCRAELKLGDEFVVGFCGSLKPWHGVDLLLSAFGRLLQTDPSARLLIVGSGPAEAALRDDAQSLGLGQAVRFTGAVPHAQVPALLRSMDVAVAPFQTMDHFYFSPIKLFEYMAAETCVIASALGQMEDVVQDQVNGLLCPPDDVDALVDTIERARRSPDLRARLASQARQDACRHYTWSHAAERTVEVIETARERTGQTAAATTGSPEVR